MFTLKSISSVVLVAATLALSSGRAVAGDPSETKSQQITVISRSGGPTLTSDDGGTTWRVADEETERRAQQRIGRSLQMTSMGNMFSNTSVSADPNTGVASIRFTALQPGEIVLSMLDARGVEVARVFEGKRSAGTYTMAFDTSTLTSGVYCFRIMNDGAITGGGTMVVAR